MKKRSSNNLIWIDLEMTGLNPDTDRILEIACVITDKNLNIIDSSEAIAINQSQEILNNMDEWNTEHHTNSGLISRVQNSCINDSQAEEIMLKFIELYVPEKKSPICGNSICQDRRFLYRYMPKLENYFHYRNLDVSTIKILARSWFPKITKTYKKQTQHQALSDIYDSINELKFYRETIFINK